MTKSTHVEALAAIDSERAYQDSFWPENAPADPRPLSIGEDILLIEQYHNMAAEQADKGLNVQDQVRKIAGIGVRCLENHGGSKPGAPATLTRALVYTLLVADLAPIANVSASVAAELATIRTLADEARAVWSVERRPEIGALYKVRAIVAVAMRCMQHYGAPLRCR